GVRGQGGMSLRWRIASILALVALGVGAFAAGASYLTTASELRAGIDDTLQSRAAAVNSPGDAGRGGRGGDGPGGGQGRGDPGGGCPNAGSFQPASAAQLVAPDGTVTACIAGGPALAVTDKERALRAGTVELGTVTIDGEDYRLLSTPWHDGGTLQIARSLADPNSLLAG